MCVCVCVAGGVPRNLQVIERASEEVKNRTTLFRKVCIAQTHDISPSNN